MSSLWEVASTAPALLITSRGRRLDELSCWRNGLWPRARPVATTHALATRAVDLGAIVIQDAPALELVAAGNKMAGVRTPVGVVSAHKVVNCAGPWAATLLAPLGIAVDIQPTRHQMCLFRRPPGFDSHPVIVDTPNRTYMRPDSGHLTAFGVGVYDEVVDPDTYHQGRD